jgi:hypothetical protein
MAPVVPATGWTDFGPGPAPSKSRAAAVGPLPGSRQTGERHHLLRLLRPAVPGWMRWDYGIPTRTMKMIRWLAS